MPRSFWRPPRRVLPIRSRLDTLDDADTLVRLAAGWALDECLLSSDWRDTGAGALMWVRRHPSRPRYALVFLAFDLAGRGLPRCVVELSLRRSQLHDYREMLPVEMQRSDPSMARRLVQVARARAERTDTTDPPEWPFAEPLLGPVTEAHDIPDFRMTQAPQRKQVPSAPLIVMRGRAAEA